MVVANMLLISTQQTQSTILHFSHHRLGTQRLQQSTGREKQSPQFYVITKTQERNQRKSRTNLIHILYIAETIENFKENIYRAQHDNTLPAMIWMMQKTKKLSRQNRRMYAQNVDVDHLLKFEGPWRHAIEVTNFLELHDDDDQWKECVPLQTTTADWPIKLRAHVLIITGPVIY